MHAVVSITGVSRHLGGRLAAQLAADPSVDRVIGVDTAPPRTADLVRLGRTEFVRADIRNPLIAKVMAQAQVDTVVHASVLATPRVAGARADEGDERHRHHAAARGVPEVRHRQPGRREVDDRRLRRVARTIRPCSPRTCTPIGHAARGYAQDAVEVEGYVRGFAAAAPGHRGNRAALGQLHRPGRRDAAGALPRDAGGAHLARLRPAAAAAARERRRRGRCAWRRSARGRASSTWPATASLTLAQAIRHRRADAPAGARSGDLAGRRLVATPAWPTSRPSRPASSTTVGWCAPASCGPSSPYEPRYTTREALRSYVDARPAPRLAAGALRGAEHVVERLARRTDAPRDVAGARGRGARVRSMPAGGGELTWTRRAVIPLHGDGTERQSRSRPDRHGIRRSPAPRPSTGSVMPPSTRRRRRHRRRGSSDWPAAWPSCAAGSAGDYEVDEFGFDRDLYRARLLQLLSPLYDNVVPRRGERHRQRARTTAARCSWPTTPAGCGRWTPR